MSVISVGICKPFTSCIGLNTALPSFLTTLGIPLVLTIVLGTTASSFVADSIVEITAFLNLRKSAIDKSLALLIRLISSSVSLSLGMLANFAAKKVLAPEGVFKAIA